jgi:hypothetical protein
VRPKDVWEEMSREMAWVPECMNRELTSVFQSDRYYLEKSLNCSGQDGDRVATAVRVKARRRARIGPTGKTTATEGVVGTGAIAVRPATTWTQAESESK